MIRLARADKPEYLTDQTVAELTTIFVNENRPVWNRKEIKDPLLESSGNKCAYCECLLSTESTYMEVEHFEDKHHNPELVVCWENLLPSCKRCNAAKGSHDVTSEPIINPYEIDPKNHILLDLFRFRGIDELGTTSIESLDLNNTDRLVKKRFEVADALCSSLVDARDRLSLYEDGYSTRRRNALLGLVDGLLRECQPTSIYAATCASVMMQNEDYLLVRQSLIGHSIWSGELEELHQNAQEIALEIVLRP